MGKTESAGSTDPFSKSLEQPLVELHNLEFSEDAKNDKQSTLAKRASLIRSMVRLYGDDPAVQTECTKYMSPDSPSQESYKSPNKSGSEELGEISVNLTDDIVKDYLNKSDSYRLLSDSETRTMFEKIERGVALLEENVDIDALSVEDRAAILDMVAARQILISANLKLVPKHVRKRYRGNDTPLPIADLLMAGTEGLADGIDRFDVSKGVKLRAYAADWIKRSIADAIGHESRPIRIPTKKALLFGAINKGLTELEDKLGRKPTDDETLKWLAIKQEDLDLYRRSNDLFMISLDEPIGDGETSLGELLSDPNTDSFDDKSASKLSTTQDTANLIAKAALTRLETIVVAARHGIHPSVIGHVAMLAKSGDDIVTYQSVHDKLAEANGSNPTFDDIGQAMDGRTGASTNLAYLEAMKKLKEAAANLAA